MISEKIHALLLALSVAGLSGIAHSGVDLPKPVPMPLEPVEKAPIRSVQGLNTIELKLKAVNSADETWIPVTIYEKNILKLKPVKDANIPGRLIATVVNYEEKTVAVIPADMTDSMWKFNFTPREYGYYVATITPEGGGDALYRTAFAVVRPLPERWTTQPVEDFTFGVNVHFEHKQGDLTTSPILLRDAGFRWIRDTLYWTNVEKKKGEYAIFPERIEVTKTLKQYGLESLFCLCYDNPKIYPHDKSPEEAQAYGNYVGHVVKELTGLVNHFEIWNEPNGFAKIEPRDYPRFLEAGYKSAKAANPNAFIVGIGGASAGGWSGHYVGDIVKAGGAAWMDTFSIHPYCSPHTAETGYSSRGGPAPRSSLDYTQPNTGHLAQAIQSAKNLNARPAVWVTEIGWPSNAVGSLERQAQQIARNYLYSASLPQHIARTFLYDFFCDGNKPEEKEHNFGLVEYEYSPRPSYIATATAARAIDGLKFRRRIPHPDSNVRIYAYGTGKDAIIAAWLTEISPEELESGKMNDGRLVKEDDKKINRARVADNEPRTLEVRLSGLPLTSLELSDWQDRRSTLTTDAGGNLVLTLNHWPQYIRGAGENVMDMAASPTEKALAEEQARFKNAKLTDFFKTSGVVQPAGKNNGNATGIFSYNFPERKYDFREINIGNVKFDALPDLITFNAENDGSNLFFRLRLKDANGEIFQYDSRGKLDGNSKWQQISFDMHPLKIGSWAGDNNKVLDLPASVFSLVIVNMGDKVGNGNIRLQDFYALTRNENK